MTPTEQKAFDAVYADAMKQSRPGTIRDIARLCYEAALTAANAVSAKALITIESSLRFRLECEQQKSADLLDEVRELKGKLFKARQPQAQGEWKHCSPELLNSGVSCRDTPRRPCECEHGGSHDHWIAHPQATEPQAQGVSNPLGWYCVSRDGLATQCADQRDAEMTAKSANRDWPNSAPYRAVQLCEFEAHPQATEPAGWKLVPVEPTPAMLSSFYEAHGQWINEEGDDALIYRAMLAAAPEAP